MTGRRHSQFKKILIGFDGSPQLEKATETDLSLAQSLDSKVLLFVVARPPEPATMVELNAMLDDAQEHFLEKFGKIAQRAKVLEVELETDIAVGHPVEQIVHRVETDHVDLIVLGRRGMSENYRAQAGRILGGAELRRDELAVLEEDLDRLKPTAAARSELRESELLRRIDLESEAVSEGGEAEQSK